MDERDLLYKELTDLVSAMNSPAEGATYGDWRMVRVCEYNLVGKEVDAEELAFLKGEYHEKREAYRSRIDEIKKQLEELEK